MGIPDEIIKRGRVVIYNDTENRRGLVSEIETYNIKMQGCRRKKRLLEEIKYAYIILNLFVLRSFISSNAEIFFSTIPLAVVVLAVNAAMLIFAVFKNKFYISAAVSMLFTVIDWRFIFLFAANIVFCLIIWRIEKPLKNLSGYPFFHDIYVIYEDRNSSDRDQYDR